MTAVLITGNTFPVKDQIKALGGKWDAESKGWRVPADKADSAQKLVTNAPDAYRAGSIVTTNQIRPEQVRRLRRQGRTGPSWTLRLGRIYRSGECQDCYEERKMGLLAFMPPSRTFRISEDGVSQLCPRFSFEPPISGERHVAVLALVASAASTASSPALSPQLSRRYAVSCSSPPPRFSDRSRWAPSSPARCRPSWSPGRRSRRALRGRCSRAVGDHH